MKTSKTRRPRLEPSTSTSHLRGDTRTKSAHKDAKVYTPPGVKVQRLGYLPHKQDSEMLNNANARGIYTGEELNHRSRI